MYVDPGYGKLRNFDAKIATYDNAPDECTIYPVNADEDRSTVWLTAQDGSYVSASAMR